MNYCFKNVFISFLFIICFFGVANGQTEGEFQLSTSWSSKYMEYGANELPGSSIMTTGLEVYVGEFVIGFEHISGQEKSYDELGFIIEKEFENNSSDLVITLQYYTEKVPDKESELEFVLSYSAMQDEYMCFFAEAIYNFEEDGAFFLVGLSRDLNTSSDMLEIVPYMYLGLDCGYHAETAKLRSNHFQFGFEGEYELACNLDLIFEANRSLAMHNLKDLDEPSASWGSVGLEYHFK